VPCCWILGNVVPATHGETVIEDLRRLTPAELLALQVEIAARPPSQAPPRQRLPLGAAPLAYLDPTTLALAAPPGAAAPQGSGDPVAALLARTPIGVSTLTLTVDDGATGGIWQEETTLLESGPSDAVFRVEIDEAGAATVVFGDGVFGLRPDEGSTVTATYRVGGGTIGNVGADTLTRDIAAHAWINAVTNPLPAQGGRDLETSQHARLTGPPSSHDPLMLVTAGDYQQAATSFVDAVGDQPIRQARANFSWTGSWLTAMLAVEPAGATALDDTLAAALGVAIDERRLAGYDVGIVPAQYMSLDLIVAFCTARGFQPGDVEAGLLQALGNGVLPNGSLGFFNPDRFGFGTNLYISQLYAAIMAVPGVDTAQITRLALLHSLQPDADTATNLARGFLDVAADQIVRLDNDRNFPENGVLTLVVTGVET
jgi:predicted phage baseplate assembly protein